jgi:hypothetical protein
MQRKFFGKVWFVVVAAGLLGGVGLPQAQDKPLKKN